MVKKYFFLLFFCFFLTGCVVINNSNNSLNAYKIENVKKIDNLKIVTLAELTYDYDKNILNESIEEYKRNVMNATNKTDIDHIVSNAIIEMEELKDKYILYGTFMILETAYEEGILTVEVLNDLARWLNSNTTPTFDIDSKTVLKIKKSRVYELRSIFDLKGFPLFPHASVDDVTIKKYYGTVNGYYLLIVEDKFNEYPPLMIPHIIRIGGVNLVFKTSNLIRLWKEYDL